MPVSWILCVMEHVAALKPTKPTLLDSSDKKEMWQGGWTPSLPSGLFSNIPSCFEMVTSKELKSCRSRWSKSSNVRYKYFTFQSSWQVKFLSNNLRETISPVFRQFLSDLVFHVSRLNKTRGRSLTCNPFGCGTLIRPEKYRPCEMGKFCIHSKKHISTATCW